MFTGYTTQTIKQPERGTLCVCDLPQRHLYYYFFIAAGTKNPFLIPDNNLTWHMWLQMQIVSNILYFCI